VGVTTSLKKKNRNVASGGGGEREGGGPVLCYGGAGCEHTHGLRKVNDAGTSIGSRYFVRERVLHLFCFYDLNPSGAKRDDELV
jgi:hypothetical protein